MAIETNLNQAPYFDDFDESKNFHRVLFRPGYSVQARELTQMQSILQNQTERFANEILVDGTIVTGVNLKPAIVSYVKLRDKDANNRVLLLGDFFTAGKVANVSIVGSTSGMTAELVDAKEGSEAASPNYLSLFVAYTNSGANTTTKAFTDNETLILRHSGNNEFVVAANSISTSSTGKGMAVTVSDGVIYHKGNFINVLPQLTIVDKYSTSPDKKLGFETKETIIDSNIDSSLLDNSTGSTNFAAPGASRLKLEPILSVRTSGSANTTSFFGIANIEKGAIVQKNTDTIYSDIGTYIDDRTYETSGNFAIDPFNIRIREHLKKTNTLGRFNQSGGGDYTKLVAEVEKGVGYVGGERITLQSTVYRDFDKATEWDTKNGRTIGQAFGNYVFAKNVVGTWDFQGLREVTLHDATQNGISGKNMGATGASGTSIGSAKVRGFQYHSGIQGTVNCQYRIYLFDVQIDSGKSFSEVRGIYEANGGSLNSMCDVVLETNGSAKLQEPSLNTLVFPFAQRGTKTLKDSSNNIDTQFVYRTEKTVTFATDGTVTVSANAAHAGGTEVNNDTGTPLTNTDEKNVIIISKSDVTTQPHSGQVSQFTGNTVTGSGTSFTTDYNVGDFITITDGANNVTEIISSITNNTTLNVSDTFAYTRSSVGLAHKTTFASGHIFDLSNGGTINSTSSQHQINLGQANLASTFTASVYFNRLRSDAVQTNKTVNKDKFIHVNTGSHTASKNGPWPLGVSDAFKLVTVYKGSNTTVSTIDDDVTSHFELDKGQKDSLYGASKLVQKATSSLDLTNIGLMVKFNYFGRDTSTGIGYLSVDSYPIDDVKSANTTAINTQEIPVYNSPTNGKRYDLRDSVDFRPIMNNGTTPSSTGTVASAPTNPSNGSGFNIDASAGAMMPTPDENFQTDIQYYLPRTDLIVMTKEGNVESIKGVASLTPRTPDALAGSMTLATLNIPPYPSLSPYVAKQHGRSDYQVNLALTNNRRYTMKDLRAVESRIKNLEYYSSLNTLEISALNKQLFGSTGIDRFKNGFLVDSFVGHNVADTSKVGYRAAIDKNRRQLRPTFIDTVVPFSKDTSLSVNTVKTGNLLTLSYSNVDFNEQPFASKLRNPVQESTFNWAGEIGLEPPADNTGDTITLPDVQVDFEGMYNAIEEIAEMTGLTTGFNFGDWSTTSTSRNNGFGWQDFNTNQKRQGEAITVSPLTEEQSLGSAVQSVAVREYMRSRLLKFTAVGMRPNTRVYPYFDDETVSDYCTPANSSFANSAPEGSSIVTNSSGSAYGMFRIPADDNLRFRVGTKRFELKDVADVITQSDLISTSAHGDYTSIGLDVVEQGSTIKMVTPQFTTRAVTERQTLTTSTFRAWPSSDNDDPLSQTFTAIANESDGAFITKIDLFFGKKSETFPVTVWIREVINGMPTSTKLPYGSKTLEASEVNADASTPVATTFTFDSPVFLKNGTDYAFTIKPAADNPDYAVWVSELGGKDVISNELIYKQPATGVMLTSANDKTWTPHQKEDIKYKIHKAKFSTSVGSIQVTNDDVDYCDADNFYSTFNHGEKVVAESVITLKGITGNTSVIKVGTMIANTTGTSANGVVRSIVQEHANGSVVVKIDPYNTPKFDTMATGNNTITITASNFTNGKGKVGTFTANTNSGLAKHFDPAAGKFQIDLPTGTFANGYIRGQVSGATTRITSVGNLPYNLAIPKVPQILYGNTAIKWTARTTSASGVISSDYENIDLSAENVFSVGEKKVYSKSNEASLTPADGSTKSFVMKGTMQTSDENVSPIIDDTRINGIIINNIINDDSTDEHKEVGNSAVRYISKAIELDDGQDAEDLSVFLTSYKPHGTNIRVYARLHNAEDSDDFGEKDYTPLTQITSSNTYSDSVNTEDFKEFEFGLSANTDGSNFLVSANSHAHLNSSNSGVVAYRSAGGSIYHTYKTFSIKIVMTSTGTNIVPLVKDMRAIAVQK